MAKVRIRTKRPYIAYPGSFAQQGYGEDTKHGYLLWDIETPGSFDVRFHELVNPMPYVTLKWSGDVTATVAEAKAYPSGARFRIHSVDALQQKDVSDVTQELKQRCLASEVTFKTDNTVVMNTVKAAGVSVGKGDLRNVDVLLRMVKDHHKNSVVTDAEWEDVSGLLATYIEQCPDVDGTRRNCKWALRKMQFDNTLAYGEGNVINFEALSGIVGVFGANRTGKSSLVGTIMYALFNTTDRGSVKGMWVPNVRKQHCLAKAFVNVDGVDYVFERQTVKHQNKQMQTHANTSLNVFRMLSDGTVEDLAGEQRSDTEKTVRSLIGTADDFLMTSLSAQGDAELFITQGPTKRRQVVSKFLDLDVFDRMHALVKDDLKECQAQLKVLPERDWINLITTSEARITSCDDAVSQREHLLVEAHSRVNDLRNQLAKHQGVSEPVTLSHVEGQKKRIASLETSLTSHELQVTSASGSLQRDTDNIAEIDEYVSTVDVAAARARVDAMNSMQTSLISLRHAHEKEATLLKQQERTLKVLDDVPCGDSFPTCKFIKDAHPLKTKVGPQREKTQKALVAISDAEASLEVLKKDPSVTALAKVEQLKVRRAELEVQVSRYESSLAKHGHFRDQTKVDLDFARSRLVELEEAYKNDENVEVADLRSKLEQQLSSVKSLDVDRLNLTSEASSLRERVKTYVTERSGRGAILQKMKVFELVEGAISRKGIPRHIVASQLPLVNDEVAKLMSGIFDFTLTLEADVDDTLDIYIDYGDSKRIIELASGMEKVVAATVIRVALTNLSTLPKTDMIILDECFGPLDPSGVEMCTRLLTLLKRYFRLVMVISHVEAVKDAVDQHIEVIKVEKDAKVVVE